jgi:chemotaxis protein MotA
MRLPAGLRMLFRSGPAGVAFATSTLAAALAAVTGFLDPRSVLVTVGGALGVAWVTFSREGLANAWRYLGMALEEDEFDGTGVIETLKRLARVYRLEGVRALESATATVEDPLLRRAIGLSFECEDEDELTDALLAEARVRAAEGEAARHVLVTLGKLFPAFGLIGTLIGLALLLRNLASADVAAIGPGLGMAVLTTLYGAVLSNVVVLPLATKLQTHLAHERLRIQMVIEGALLLQHKEFPTRIERTLRRYVAAAPSREGERLVQFAERAA